jgi:hypothetical protein
MKSQFAVGRIVAVMGEGNRIKEERDRRRLWNYGWWGKGMGRGADGLGWSSA